jgi:hypothetical protein
MNKNIKGSTVVLVVVCALMFLVIAAAASFYLLEGSNNTANISQSIKLNPTLIPEQTVQPKISPVPDSTAEISKDLQTISEGSPDTDLNNLSTSSASL